MKRKLRVAGLILLGMAIGSVGTGSLLLWHYARLFKDQYYTQLASSANVVYMIRAGRQEQLVRDIEANVAQSIVAADKMYGKDEKRLGSFWLVQRYYEAFGLKPPPDIAAILADLPPRPLTACEEKKCEQTRNKKTADPGAVLPPNESIKDN